MAFIFKIVENWLKRVGWGYLLKETIRSLKIYCWNFKTLITYIFFAFVGVSRRGVKGDPLFISLEDNNIDPARIDFLSIDVDNCDLEIFEAIKFKPKVVLLEDYLHFNPKVKGEAADIVRNTFHHPIRVILKTVEMFEYVPVYFLHDLYLVRKDLAKQFKKFDLAQLYADCYLGAPKWLWSKMDDVNNKKTLEKEHIRLLSKY